LPLGNVPEITGVGDGAIVNENGKAAEVFPLESVTVAVPVIVAAARGVPEIVTVLPLPAGGKVRVAGNPVMFHVKGATPPVTVSMPLYGVPTVPFGNVPKITGTDMWCPPPQLRIGIIRRRPTKRRNTLRRSIKASRHSAYEPNYRTL
jgi:hypothetical protein